MGAVGYLKLGRAKSDDFNLTGSDGKLSDFRYSFRPGTGGGANVASISIAVPTEADENKLFGYLAANEDRKYWFKFGWQGDITGDSDWIRGHLAKIDYKYNVGQELVMTLHLHSIGTELMGEARTRKGSMTTASGKVGGTGIVAGGHTWGSAVIGNLAQLLGNTRDGKVKVTAVEAKAKLDEAANAMKSHFGATMSFSNGTFGPTMGDVEGGDTTFKDIVCMDHLVSEAGFAWTCPPSLMGAGETRGIGDWSNAEINSMWGTRHDAWGTSQGRGSDWASRYGFMNEYLESLGYPDSTGGSRGFGEDLTAGGGGLPDATRDLIGSSGENEGVAEGEDVELINHSGPGQSDYLTWNDLISYINELGAKYGLTNADQLLIAHQNGDDWGSGGGDGSLLGAANRGTVVDRSIVPKAISSLGRYGITGVDPTIAVGTTDRPSAVESLECKQDNIIALLPTPHALSTVKLKTPSMGEAGSYGEDMKEVEDEDPADDVSAALDGLIKPLEHFKDDLVGLISYGRDKLKAFFDANVGKTGDKTVEVEGGSSEENSGLKNKNKYSSHDNLSGERISKGTAAAAAAIGSDWAKAMWEVRVTCLGIPEISSQHEFNREVTLSVPSPRGGAGTSKLSGNYFVHDFIHTINSSDAFKTTLILRGYPF